MPVGEVRIKGLRQLHSSFKRYDNELKLELERELRDAGELVADKARDLFSSVDARSAEGFQPRLRGFGRVTVEQKRRRTTGQRPDFGSLQMRTALLPSVAISTDRIMEAMEGMLDRIGRESGF
jgi:hypothetical protein